MGWATLPGLMVLSRFDASGLMLEVMELVELPLHGTNGDVDSARPPSVALGGLRVYLFTCLPVYLSTCIPIYQSTNLLFHEHLLPLKEVLCLVPG